MRYEDISSKTADEVRNIIKTDCSKFYNEFIKNGIQVFRLTNGYDDVELKETVPKRTAKGWMSGFNKGWEEYIDKKFFIDNGVCSRLNHAVYAITNNSDDIAAGLSGRLYWCVPKGDFTYSYVPGVQDYNYPNKSTTFIQKAANTIRHLSNSFDMSLDDFKNAIECDDSDLNNVIAELFEIKDISGDDDALEFKEHIVSIRDAIHEIPNVYINNQITSSLHHSTEIVFNCKEYYIFCVSQYNIMDIFKINTSVHQKSKYDTEEKRIKAIELNPSSIKEMLSLGIKPSEEIQQLLVSTSSSGLRYLLEGGVVPSEETQLLVIKINSRNLVTLIAHDIEPTEKVILDALSDDGTLIRHIDNQSEKMKMLALSENTYSIRYINDPSEEMQIQAIKDDVDNIRWIKKPTKNAQLFAVNLHGRAIQYIDKPSEELKMVAVKHYGKNIRFIRNPSEEVQLAAVENNQSAIHYIENPTKKVEDLHYKLWGEL